MHSKTHSIKVRYKAVKEGRSAVVKISAGGTLLASY